MALRLKSAQVQLLEMPLTPASPPSYPPTEVPSLDEVLARSGGENFPVALRILGRSTRSHLLAIYGFARLVDQLGDEAPGDRRQLLDWLEAELDRAYAGRAVHGVMVALSRTIAELDLDRAPFCDLIEANRRDQAVSRYATFDDLVEYCRYSANPVGRLVLAAFGASTDERVALSDRVCTALQVLEHTQDVGEDAARGRIYLPVQDLARFGCVEEALTAPGASPELRAVVALQVARARILLESASPLVDCLRGTARVAVAGFAAGGLATAEAIERAGFDVLAQRCPPSRAGTAAHALRLLAGAARGGHHVAA